MDRRDLVIVEPSSGISGEVRVPGDKSISHRAVVMGSIAWGVTEVEGLLEGEDTLRTIEAFRLMDVEMERPGEGRLLINGRGMEGLKEPEDVIDAGNSGTTARLLTGLLASNPFDGFFSVITGDRSLRRRPMKRVVEPLLMMGASIAGRSKGSLLPLAVSGRALRGLRYLTPVASAQLKSALLLAGLFAEGETIVQEPLRSRDHTERMLGLFGADIEVSDTVVKVRGGRPLRARSIRVPGDLSSAAFLIVAALITRRSELVIRDVGVNPTRRGVIDILKKMGGDLEVTDERVVDGEPVADIVARSSHLRGIKISGGELLPAIDEFPVICVAAALAEGVTTIEGAGELRVKESDRIAAMAEGLKNIGVEAGERPGGIVIKGCGPEGSIRGGRVKSHGDHRIAMAMAVAGLVSRDGVSIEDPDCVDVSFPGFFEILSKVRR